MRKSLPTIAAIATCLLLGGFAAGVQPRAISGAASTALSQQLAAATRARLDAEFLEQSVGFRLSGVRVWPATDGQLRLRAEGKADFGVEGEAVTTVEALYDPASGEWLRLDYQLL